MVICGDGQDDVEMILAASGHINGDFWFYFFIFCFLFSPDYYLVELPGLQQGRGVALSHRRSRRRGVRYVGTNTCHRPTPRGFFPSQPNAFAQSEDGDDQAKPQTPSPFTSRPISQLTKELSLSVPRIEVAPLPVFENAAAVSRPSALSPTLHAQIHHPTFDCLSTQESRSE
ncbi:hypothetical protein IWX49DRAFT_201774 [Phyllosticta citricarpa]